MSRSRARSIALFLDCCYGGAFSAGSAVRSSSDVNPLDAFAGDKFGGGRGWAVITASSAMEYAFEGSRLAEGSAPRARPSVFTHALVQGLATGEADLRGDGWVSLDELYDYVFDHVRRQTPNQTPSRTVDMQGDLYLARSRRRRIVPSPVPDDVRAAMRSPDLYTRRGAIAELRARMENTDLAIALGAREALEEMAQKDIRYVADEASRALSEVGVNPHPARLDFGAVPQNSPPPHRTVRLLGPPLARSCAPHPKAGWLRVTETDDGLDVRVDTAAPGRLSGDIVLKGVVGEAVVHVEAEVVPVRDITSTTSQPPKRPPEEPKRLPKEPQRPPEEPPPLETGPAASWVAPVLATAGLPVAITSAATVVDAAVKAGQTIDNMAVNQWQGSLRTYAEETGTVTPLLVALITGVAALLLCALARHDVAARRDRYTPTATSATTTLTWLTRFLAIPTVILAALMGIAYLVGLSAFP